MMNRKSKKSAAANKKETSPKIEPKREEHVEEEEIILVEEHSPNNTIDNTIPNSNTNRTSTSPSPGLVTVNRIKILSPNDKQKLQNTRASSSQNNQNNHHHPSSPPLPFMVSPKSVSAHRNNIHQNSNNNVVSSQISLPPTQNEMKEREKEEGKTEKEESEQNNNHNNREEEPSPKIEEDTAAEALNPNENNNSRTINVTLEDYSGFHNRGNDCYGCSVLTFLLRNKYFKTYLCASPLLALYFLLESDLLLPNNEETTPTSLETLKHNVLQYTKKVFIGSGYHYKFNATRKREREEEDTAPTEKEDFTLCDVTDETVQNIIHFVFRCFENTDDTEKVMDALQSTFHYLISNPNASKQDTKFSILEEHNFEKSLHYILYDYAHQITKRERFVAYFKMKRKWLESGEDDREGGGEKLKLLLQKYLHTFNVDANSRTYRHYHDLLEHHQQETSSLYYFGIFLKSIETYFQNTSQSLNSSSACQFFCGQQEDAHEFFVSLCDALEEEVKQFYKRGALFLEKGELLFQQESEKMMDPEKGLDHLFQTLLRDDDEEEEEQKKKNTLSKAVTPNWVNTVLQGKLLNIIQCHHPLDTDENNKKVCGHEIVKEETFLNLTLNVPDEEKKVEKKKKTEDPFENHLAIPVDDITDDTEEEEEEKCYSLFKLLSQSIFAHSKLENYACDECKTKNSQIQSAVFYGTLPVLLVIQLKRFYLKLIYDEKEDGKKEVVDCVSFKNFTKVMSDETLTLYSIPQEEKEYYDAEKLVFTDVIHEKLEKNDDVLVLETKYVLKSVLLHLGKSLNYGHYLTEFGVEKRNAQNHHMKWRRANDERVTVVDHQHNDKDSIKNSQNYLLLYEKVSETLVSKPAKEVFNLGKEEA